jgi:hypothetical protein
LIFVAFFLLTSSVALGKSFDEIWSSFYSN